MSIHCHRNRTARQTRNASPPSLAKAIASLIGAVIISAASMAIALSAVGTGTAVAAPQAAPKATMALVVDPGAVHGVGQLHIAASQESPTDSRSITSAVTASSKKYYYIVAGILFILVIILSIIAVRQRRNSGQGKGAKAKAVAPPTITDGAQSNGGATQSTVQPSPYGQPVGGIQPSPYGEQSPYGQPVGGMQPSPTVQPSPYGQPVGGIQPSPYGEQSPYGGAPQFNVEGAQAGGGTSSTTEQAPHDTGAPSASSTWQVGKSPEWSYGSEIDPSRHQPEPVTWEPEQSYQPERSYQPEQPASEPPRAPEIPAGWYPDPAAPGTNRQRYWDGKGWTTHTNPPS